MNDVNNAKRAPQASEDAAVAATQSSRRTLHVRLHKPNLSRFKKFVPKRLRPYLHLPDNLRERLNILLILLVLLASNAYSILQPLFARDAYALGDASSLLSPTNPSLSQRVKYDAQEQAYTFNNGYVPAAAGVAQAAGPRITAIAHQDATQGITVSDPAYNTNFTLKPQFDLMPGQQDKNRIIYPLSGNKGWLVYGMHSASVKEDVILTHAPGDELTLKYNLGLNDGMEARQESDGSIGVYGNTLLAGNVATSSDKDAQLLQKARQNAEKNTLLFTIPAPVVVESGKKKSDVQSSFHLSGDSLELTTKGLKKATYPLTIDPSIYVETAEKFMRGNNETNVDFDVDDTLIQKGETTGARFDDLTSTMSLPSARWNQGTAVAGGYMYVVGGSNGSSNQASIYWAKFNTTTHAITSPNPGNGTCASWCTNNAYDLPAPRAGLSLVAYNGYLYALGGEDASCTTTNGTGANGVCKTVYIAKIGANGEPQLWHPTNNDQNSWTYWYRDTDLSSPRSYAAAAAYNNRLYLLGGKTDSAAGGVSTVEYTNLNPTGTLTPWTSSGMTALPSVRFGHDAHIYNGYLYLVGGNSNGTLENTVDYIKIGDDGTLMGGWTGTNGFQIPRMSWGGNFSAIWGGYLYVSGGCAAVDAEGQCTSSGIANAGTAKADGSGTSVELASINADGSIGFWGSISNVANAQIGYGLVAWRNAIYTVGGCTAQDTTTGACTTTSSAVHYGVVNGDGDGSTVGTSQPSGTAPCSGSDPSNCNLPGSSSIGNMLSATAIVNGYLYIIGGCTSNDCSSTSGNTLYAAIDADGQLRRPAACPGGNIVDSFCLDNIDPIPGGLAAAGTAVFGGSIYVVGGQNGSGLKGNIYHVDINNDGSLNGTWTAQSFSSVGATSVSYTFTYARANPSSAGSHPGNLFIFGGCTAGSGVGCNSGSNSNAVYKCNIDTDGGISGCSTTNQLQIGTIAGASSPGLALHAGTVYAGYIYLVGGVAPGLTDLKSIRYAKFDDDNNVVAVSGSGWIEPKDSSGNPVEMSTGRRRGTAFGYNGYLYAIGGYDANGGGILSDIQFAKINVSNGSLEQFNVSTVSINQRWGLSVPVSNSYAYIIGGCVTGNSPTCTARTDIVQTFQVYNNDSGAPAGYSSAANLFPTDRFGVSATVNNNYIYVAGGCVGNLDCNDATNAVEYAPLNADGSVGSWQTATNLPADRVYGQLEQAGGTLYYIGGQDDSRTAQSTIYYATPAADGTISSWSTASGGIGNTASSAAVARTQLGGTVWNNRIFLLGGNDNNNNPTNTVFVSPQLNSGGNIPASSWTSATGFNVARNGLTAIAYANNLYLLGGHDGGNFLSDVQYTKINADGTLNNSWNYAASLPRNVSDADGFAANGYMYIFGGKQSDIRCTTNTYVAPISANTTIATGNNPTGLGEWFQTNERFSAERSGLAAVYNQGKAYLLGGSCGTLEGGGGTVVMQDDIDPGIDSTMWSDTGGMSASTACGTLSSGNALVSSGGSGPQAATKDVDVSYGGSIQFYLRIPRSSSSGCTGASSTNNSVQLQYSGNGGSGWTTLATYSSANFNTPQLIKETIPSGAWTPTTRFRWYIPNARNNRDYWAIDDIVVTANTTPPTDLLMEDDFDPNLDSTVWSSTNGMGVGTTCGTLSSGNAFYSTGGSQAQAITNNVNLQYGGQVKFTLRIPASSAGGCDQPGNNNDLVLQYSTNNGGTWNTFATYDKSAYDTATVVTTAVPSGADSSTVRFRWYIPTAGSSGNQWAIDDVSVSAFKPILTFTGIHRVVSTALLSQPQVANYSIMFDTDSDVFPTNWLLNGVDNSIGAKWQLNYRSMTNTTTSCTSTAMPTWGQNTNFGDVTLGLPGVYTPKDGSGNNTNCARYYYFSAKVDSSRAYGYPEDVTRGPTITDLTLQFTADPSKRLMHGRTFTGGLQQPVDTPLYAY